MHSRPDALPVHARRAHRHTWLWEPLEADATFVLRSMFGAKAAYLDGKLMLCFCASDEPWRGVLVCTDHVQQPSLRVDFPALTPHPILPKWLYLPESNDRFEAVATRLVRLALARDPRIGVLPKPRPRRKPKTGKSPAGDRQRERSGRPRS